MKKLLMVAIVIVSVATLVSCGAASRNQTGLATKSSDLGATQFASLGMSIDNAYIYTTPDYNCDSALTAAGINLTGIFPGGLSGRTVKDFNMSLFIDSAYKQAYIYMYFEFNETSDAYRYILTSSGAISVSGGLMQITFTDGSNIAFTSSPSTAGNGAIVVNMQDSASSVAFATNTQFVLSQIPTATK